jgi:hypothetical protein
VRLPAVQPEADDTGPIPIVGARPAPPPPSPAPSPARPSVPEAQPELT